jgi:hypothetical protein
LSLRVSPLKDLKPHEETIPSEVEKIKAALLSSGAQKAPLIVDAETGVILDGTHRYRSMVELGLRYAVVYAVQYSQPEIVVKRWLPCAQSADLSSVKEALEQKTVENIAAASAVEEQRAPFALLSRKGGYLSTERFRSIFEAYWGGWCLFQRAASAIEFSSDAESIESLLRKFELILYRPTLNKQDVLGNALQGRLFPPKSSRHILPSRPKDICFRLSYLRGD